MGVQESKYIISVIDDYVGEVIQPAYSGLCFNSKEEVAIFIFKDEYLSNMRDESSELKYVIVELEVYNADNS